MHNCSNLRVGLIFACLAVSIFISCNKDTAFVQPPPEEPGPTVGSWFQYDRAGMHGRLPQVTETVTAKLGAWNGGTHVVEFTKNDGTKLYYDYLDDGDISRFTTVKNRSTSFILKQYWERYPFTSNLGWTDKVDSSGSWGSIHYGAEMKSLPPETLNIINQSFQTKRAFLSSGGSDTLAGLPFGTYEQWDLTYAPVLKAVITEASVTSYRDPRLNYLLIYDTLTLSNYYLK